MTALQIYALLSPVLAFAVMSAFAAVLMKQTKRDIEQLAKASVNPDMIVDEHQVPAKSDKALKRSFAQP